MKNNDILKQIHNLEPNPHKPQNRLLQLINSATPQSQKLPPFQINDAHSHKDYSHHHPSPCINTDTSELHDLLRTNRILIDNKKKIHQNKIRILSEKLMKLQKLLRSSRDSEQQVQLQQKIADTRNKKKQSQLKLQKLNKMEIQMIEVQHHKQNVQSEHQTDNRYDQQIENMKMIVSHQNTNNIVFEDNPNHRNRCLSLHQGHSKTLNRTSELHNPHISLVNKNLSDSMDRHKAGKSLKKRQIDDSFDDLYYTGFGESTKKNLIGQTSGKHNQGKIKINDFIENESLRQKLVDTTQISKLLKQLSKALQLNKQEQIQLLMHLSNPINPQQLYNSIVSILTQLNQIINCRNKQHRNVVQSMNSMKQQYQKEMESIVDKQRRAMEQIDGLIGMKSTMIEQTIGELEQYGEMLERIAKEGTKVSQNMTYKNRVYSNIKFDSLPEQYPELKCGIQEYCTKFQLFLQTTNLKLLQLTESKLSMQYKVSNLSVQETDHRKMLKQLVDTVQKEQSTLKTLVKQIENLRRQNMKLETNKKLLNEQVSQLEDLCHLKKSNYSELQDKYACIKSKKTKLEKTIKNLSESIMSSEHTLELLVSKTSEKESYLNEELLEQTKNLQRQKLSLNESVQKISQEIYEQTDKLQNLSQQIEWKEKTIKKAESEIKKMNKIKEKLTKDIQERKQKLEGLVLTVQEKQAYLQTELQSMDQQLNQKKSEEKILTERIDHMKSKKQQLQSQYSQQKQTYTSLVAQSQNISSHIENMKSEFQQLSIAKEQLQQILGEMLVKKQNALKELQEKYQVLSELNQNLIECENQLETQFEELQVKEEYATKLQDKIEQLEQELLRVNQTLKQHQRKVESLYQQISMHEDEQLSIQQRIQGLKQFQNKILIRIGIKREEKKVNTDIDEQALNKKIEAILQKVGQAQQLKSQLSKQKQINRKLRLQNQQLVRFHEIDDTLIHE